MEKQDKFKKIRKMMNKGGKATAELYASKNPMAWEKAHRNMSIQGLKGVAFYKGGKV